MREASIPYDMKCALEFNSLISRVGHLFIDIDIICPYGLPEVATFHQATFAPLSERAMELFLAAGYRRNGNSLYSMRCPDCSACIPIRLKISKFLPNRNQKRALRKNSDLTTEITPLAPNLENLELCDRFLEARYPKENNSARGYFKDFFLNNIISSGQIQYRHQGKLLGSGIVDIGYNWLNAVYFYFDPEESKRSLGTFNIMHLVEICLEWEIEYLYLGYLIHAVPAMNYKRNFRPHDIFRNGEWKTVV